MIVYPETDYDSWISESEADTYFEGRLNSDEWNDSPKEVAIVTAYRDLNLFIESRY